MALRMDRFIDGKFSARVNPKDGFAVLECKDNRARRVLEFLVPILYLEKPTRATIMVGNTIFGALLGKRPVDWGIVIRDVVQRVFASMAKSKATPLCPYIFHLYYTHDDLFSGEKKAYRIARAFLKHTLSQRKTN